ncbi:oxygenase MpaB family protein [Tomitella gaofuii]|uniref:oxygenase MpaB family protein n=1 Tax=Tomitella gaofuii TaxID=2760083 RepID=UPI0015FD793B|nr:oxygenase MpaB family protein [Tomitella gaofuii]
MAAPHATDLATEADGAPTVGVADYVDEAYVFLGAGAAILLQLAMPGVGHGVADHSDVLHRPLSRLRTTMSYIYAVALGTDDERREIVRMVNKAHVPVRSETYNAFDPELQLWVAATLYHGGVDLHRRFRGPLGPVSAERVYRESMAYGTALQVRAEMWPDTVAGFDRYWERTMDTLTVDDQVRAFTHTLLATRSAPWFLRPAMPLNRFVTTGLLPQQARDAFALPWSDRHQRAFDLLFRVLPPVYAVVPRFVRTLPARLYLADMRRRLRSGRGLAH